MERLTAREESGHAYYPHCFREDTCDGGGCAEHSGICDFSEKVCETLAAYEDTNLTPEQIVEIDKDYRELCEKVNKYQKLEEQGLLLRLPCAIGSTIYKFKYPTRVDEDGAEWEICDKKRATVEPLKFALCHLNSIGRLYFLTKEEAEQALAEMKGV